MRGLGELEAAVMNLVWTRDAPVTVREILTELQPVRPLAYTTVMTVFDNLHRKAARDATEPNLRAQHPTPSVGRRDGNSSAGEW
jgi:predicted transcriptional regulator